MSNTVESIVWSGISSTPAPFTLRGGNYALTIHAGAWGTATLQRLAPAPDPDHLTYVTVPTAFSADGFQNLKLPAGVYLLTLSGVSGLYGDLTAIVTQVMLGASDVLLSDGFNRGIAALNGQTPDIGPVWLTAGATGVDMVTASGEMFQNATGAAGYATSTTSATIGEVGCNFRLTSVFNQIVLGGTATGTIDALITPSGQTGTLVHYPLTGGTLDAAASDLAAEITANPTLSAAGVSATASGPVVTVVAAQCPSINVSVSGGVMFTGQTTSQPTLACFPIYPPGTDFLTGVLHFVLGVAGQFGWGVFGLGSGATLFSPLHSKIQGLSPNVVYTYRCCIAAPYAWGGLWEGSTLIGAVWAQDPRIAGLQGPCCFFETGADAGNLYYDDVWAYQTPSVPLASIQAFVGS